MHEPEKSRLSSNPAAPVSPASAAVPDPSPVAEAQPRPAPVVDLDFYGVRVRVDADSDEALRRVREDFRYFARELAPEEEPELAISLTKQGPEYDRLPALEASIYTPRNICYSRGDTTYIDYFGRALAVYDRRRGRIAVSSDSVPLLHEIAYLSILSRVGDALDRKGLHRMHALAVSRQGRAALFMMPSGCGKSTLGLGLMQASAGLELASDDSPLIGRSGRVLPFPLRIGVLGTPPRGVPERFVQHMERMEFAPKYVVSMAAFEGSLARGELRPELVFLAARSLGSDCQIRRTGLLTGYRACIRHMIVGVGIYQGLEFLLRSSVLDLVRGAPSILSRAWSALVLLSRARVYTLHLGRDRRHNVETVLEFLGRELGISGDLSLKPPGT